MVAALYPGFLFWVGSTLYRCLSRGLSALFMGLRCTGVWWYPSSDLGPPFHSCPSCCPLHSFHSYSFFHCPIPSIHPLSTPLPSCPNCPYSLYLTFPFQPCCSRSNFIAPSLAWSVVQRPFRHLFPLRRFGTCQRQFFIYQRCSRSPGGSPINIFWQQQYPASLVDKVGFKPGCHS